MGCRPTESLNALPALGDTWPEFVDRVVTCYVSWDIADWLWSSTFNVNHNRSYIPFERARTQTRDDLHILMGARGC